MLVDTSAGFDQDRAGDAQLKAGEPVRAHPIFTAVPLTATIIMPLASPRTS